MSGAFTAMRFWRGNRDLRALQGEATEPAAASIPVPLEAQADVIASSEAPQQANRVSPEAFEAMLDTMDDQEVLRLFRRLADADRAGVRRRLARTLPGLENVELPAPATDQEPSWLATMPGTRDWDNACVIGRNGFLYVLEGSNNLLASYDLPPAFAHEKATEWAALIHARAENLQRRGVRFVQVVIPEKSTAIPENFPYTLPQAATPILLGLEAQLAATPSFLSGRHAFKAQDLREPAFRKADSHLSPEGCRVLMNATLDRLGLGRLFEPFEMEIKTTDSDLGGKFPPVRFVDQAAHPTAESYGAWAGRIHREVHRPERDGVQGYRMEFHNPDAPLDMKAVAFANSFFHLGDSPTALSWWAALAFRNFTFHWSSPMGSAELDAEAPDVVICQTNERFLPTRPVDG